MIYGIDFDGTIVTEQFPEIGKPIEKTVSFIRDLQAKGHKWILITMREGKHLDDAVKWLKAQEIAPDAVNDNLPERVEMWGNNPRKVYADIYIDDHNAGGVQLPGENELEELRYVVKQFFDDWYCEDGCPKQKDKHFPCSGEEENETTAEFYPGECSFYQTKCWVEYYRWKHRQELKEKEQSK